MDGDDGLELEWIAVPACTGRCVVCTGVFDVLHVGHIRFLSAAAAVGEPLCVGVESDARVRHRKGSARPLVAAVERAELVAAIKGVGGVFVVHGPDTVWDAESYAGMLARLTPAALALTAGDPAEAGKRRAAELLGAEVIVLPRVESRSTSRLVDRACSTRGPQTFGSAKSNTWNSSVSGATLRATSIGETPATTAAVIDSSTISGSEK